MSALDFLPDTPASKRTPGYLFWTRLVPESESLLLRAGLSLSPQPQRDSSWVAIVLGCWLHHSLALWILENYFMYLCLSFLICKRRMMLPLLRADFEVKPGYHMKSAWHIIISHYYYYFSSSRLQSQNPGTLPQACPHSFIKYDDLNTLSDFMGPSWASPLLSEFGNFFHLQLMFVKGLSHHH